MGCQQLHALDNGPPFQDQRSTRRIITISRVAMVEAGGRQMLAKVCNISDGGAGVILATSLPLKSRVRVHLSTLISLEAEVAWRSERHHGLQFSAHIDCATMLRQLVEDTRTGRSRPFRLSVSRQATISSRMSVQMVTVKNISQRGLRIQHDSHFEPGLPVIVALPGCNERRGVIRWSHGGHAGVSLEDAFTLDEIAVQTGLLLAAPGARS